MVPRQVCVLLGYDEDPEDPAIERGPTRPGAPPASNVGTARPGYCHHNRLAPQCAECRAEWAAQRPDDDLPPPSPNVVNVSPPAVPAAPDDEQRQRRRVRRVM